MPQVIPINFHPKFRIGLQSRMGEIESVFGQGRDLVIRFKTDLPPNRLCAEFYLDTFCQIVQPIGGEIWRGTANECRTLPRGVELICHSVSGTVPDMGRLPAGAVVSLCRADGTRLRSVHVKTFCRSAI